MVEEEEDGTEVDSLHNSEAGCGKNIGDTPPFQLRLENGFGGVWLIHKARLKDVGQKSLLNALL